MDENELELLSHAASLDPYDLIVAVVLDLDLRGVANGRLLGKVVDLRVEACDGSLLEILRRRSFELRKRIQRLADLAFASKSTAPQSENEKRAEQPLSLETPG
ncbi:MAG: hypothetical protein AAGC60_02285 [Acidobacteriota bacterium]